jgi:DNA polymerase (family X)
MLEELRAKVPAGVVELTRIPGCGPKTAMQIHDELGVDSIEALACRHRRGQLEGLKGLGPKTEENLRESIRRIGAKDSGRIPAADALGVAEEICARLRALPEVARGGLRRAACGACATRSVTSTSSSRARTPRRSWRRSATLRRSSARSSRRGRRRPRSSPCGTSRRTCASSTRRRGGRRSCTSPARRRTTSGSASAPSAAACCSTSTACSERDEHDRRQVSAGERLAEPHRGGRLRRPRHGRGPAPDAGGHRRGRRRRRGELPRVVTVEDLRGDLHGHSDWSGDGKASLEDMVAAARRGAMRTGR